MINSVVSDQKVSYISDPALLGCLTLKPEMSHFLIRDTNLEVRNRKFERFYWGKGHQTVLTGTLLNKPKTEYNFLLPIGYTVSVNNKANSI